MSETMDLGECVLACQGLQKIYRQGSGEAAHDYVRAWGGRFAVAIPRVEFLA